MPPRVRSRYTFTSGLTDAAGRLFLSDRVPFRFVDRPDNRQWIVREGDSLYTIAAMMFAPRPRPAGLWWVLADFQPTPIFDPTVRLTPGTVIVAPSNKVVDSEILSEKRRALTQSV